MGALNKLARDMLMDDINNGVHKLAPTRRNKWRVSVYHGTIGHIACEHAHPYAATHHMWSVHMLLPTDSKADTQLAHQQFCVLAGAIKR